MPRFQYTGLELISQFILSERLGPSPSTNFDAGFYDITGFSWALIISISLQLLK